MITYVDASVVLRIVLGEEGPLDEWNQLTPVSSELTKVECLRTLERHKWSHSVATEALAEQRANALLLMQAFDLAVITSAVLERAADPFPTYVATPDAIHLATALIMREEMADIRFATHDAKLALAARSMGFTVLGA